MYREVEGNLITMALNGNFDVIAHGVNCMCVQGKGLAPQMVKAFGTDKYFELEVPDTKGDINKLGQIEYIEYYRDIEGGFYPDTFGFSEEPPTLIVVNAYTQYNYGKNHSDGDNKPVDYEAIALCMRKINHEFKGQHIGLPRIGCGLAGGDWDIVRGIIQTELKDCHVTVVNYKK